MATTRCDGAAPASGVATPTRLRRGVGCHAGHRQRGKEKNW
jgi:hypothetical protein